MEDVPSGLEAPSAVVFVSLVNFCLDEVEAVSNVLRLNLFFSSTFLAIFVARLLSSSPWSLVPKTTSSRLLH